MVNLLRYIWKNLHLPKKNYTGTARGARDKYGVCVATDEERINDRVVRFDNLWKYNREQR